MKFNIRKIFRKTIRPLGVEVGVIDNNEEPYRIVDYVIRCPKCGKLYSTGKMPYLSCHVCGCTANVRYDKEPEVIYLQDTINHLIVRINYMLAVGTDKDTVLPFILELKELSDALEYGTSFEDIKIQKWKNVDLPLEDQILYSLR